MLVFWILVTVMIALPLCIVLRRLLFPKPDLQNKNELIDITIYQARTRELDSEIENGVLMQEHLQEVSNDLKRTLLHDLDKQQEINIKPASNQKSDWWAAGIVFISLPFIAIFIYLSLGTPGIIEQSRTSASSEHEESLPDIENMVIDLASRLQNDPDDLEGWFMLANSYMVLGKYSEAVHAFEYLIERTGEHPGILSGYANALAMENNGQVSGRPEEVVRKVLELEPDNNTALWLAGMASFEQGDYPLAIDFWQRLLPQLQNDSTPYQEVELLIQHAEQLLGNTVTQTTTTGVEQTVDDQSGHSLSVRVSVSDQLLQETKPEDTLFVFARAVEGPPMPIAVVRKRAGDLPVTVILDDSSSMLEQRKLSGFDQVIVGARISRSGEAIPQSSDLTGENKTVNLSQTGSIEIVIDQKIP